MGIDKHVHLHDTIVIGGGLSALLYSFHTGCPCIFVGPSPPFRFDSFGEPLDLSCTQLHTKSFRESWEKLILLLGLNGQLPMTNRASSINIRDNLLKVTTPNSRLGRFEFKKLVIFDDTAISGLPAMTSRHEGKSKVLDWFNVRSGMEHPHEVTQTNSDFVRFIHFYPSERFGAQKTSRIRKDLVAVSFLTSEELGDFNYSDTMVRFKVVDAMKSLGIKGARNGRDTYNPELYRFYSVKIEPTEREIIPNIRNFYEKDERFEFRNDTPEEIVKKFNTNNETYALKINKKIEEFQHEISI